MTPIDANTPEPSAAHAEPEPTPTRSGTALLLVAIALAITALEFAYGCTAVTIAHAIVILATVALSRRLPDRPAQAAESEGLHPSFVLVPLGAAAFLGIAIPLLINASASQRGLGTPAAGRSAAIGGTALQQALFGPGLLIVVGIVLAGLAVALLGRGRES